MESSTARHVELEAPVQITFEWEVYDVPQSWFNVNPYKQRMAMSAVGSVINIPNNLTAQITKVVDGMAYGTIVETGENITISVKE